MIWDLTLPLSSHPSPQRFSTQYSWDLTRFGGDTPTPTLTRQTSCLPSVAIITDFSPYGDGRCVNTDCKAASINIMQGSCPGGRVQISYWANRDCTGKWFGYGYTSVNECHPLWTDGWKFKSLHFRCAAPEDDCVNKGTCTYDPEPANNVC